MAPTSVGSVAVVPCGASLAVRTPEFWRRSGGEDDDDASTWGGDKKEGGGCQYWDGMAAVWGYGGWNVEMGVEEL